MNYINVQYNPKVFLLNNETSLLEKKGDRFYLTKEGAKNFIAALCLIKHYSR